MKLAWDEPKRLKTLSERGLDFAGLDPEFFLQAVVLPARGDRFKAIGWWRGRVISIVFRPLGREGLSVISMRFANAKERSLL